MSRVLIVNPFGIGDVIFSTPLIEILRISNPSIFLGYICNKRSYEVLRTNPHLDRIFIYEKDDYRQAWRASKVGCARKLLDFLHVVKEGRFDTSIDLSLGYQYSLLLKFMGVAKRTGFDYRNRGKFLTHKVKIDWFRNKHVVEYYLDLLRFFDIDISDFDISPKVCIAPEDLKQAVRLLSENGVKGDSLVVGVIPGCGTSWGADAKYRRWPRENFAGVADGLIARYGAKVILFGDKNETSICDDIRRTMRNGVISLCGKTTIGEFLGLLSKCAFIITNDGGPLHMAAAIGLKTISIFGPVDEKVYGPYGPKEMHQVVCRTDMPCRPCYKNFKYTPCDERRCLNSLTVDNVMETVRRVLGR